MNACAKSWCAAAVFRGSAHLDLETTLDEIVSVTGDVASLDALASSCLMEAAWALPLPTAFYETWATFHVAL